VVGPSDGDALLQLMAADEVTSALHLCGREYLDLRHPEIRIERRIVYAAEAVSDLPAGAVAALQSGALALIHSPRAGRTFAELVDAAAIGRASVSAVAISPAARLRSGPGWRAVHAAPHPDDHALLELAAKLCQ
jgi:uroporphyrinogen-III synthase